MGYQDTSLFKKLSSNETLKNHLLDIRANCEKLGGTIKHLIPSFTDHTINHMDALWEVADQVFTGSEIAKFNSSEAFILGATFYLHDLGMSLAATDEGVKELKSHDKYRSFYKKAIENYRLSEKRAEEEALKITARSLHAEKAITLCTKEIPGLKKYIIKLRVSNLDIHTLCN